MVRGRYKVGADGKTPYERLKGSRLAQSSVIAKVSASRKTRALGAMAVPHRGLTVARPSHKDNTGKEPVGANAHGSECSLTCRTEVKVGERSTG